MGSALCFNTMHHAMHASMVQELVKEGLIKGIGLSEVSAEDVRKAHAVHPITAVEMEWSLFARDCEVLLTLCLIVHCLIACQP